MHNSINNKKPINILFVSIAFPPKSDSEGLQVAKYFKYLVKDKNFIFDIVTSDDKTLFMTIDETLRQYIKGCRQIIKVPFFENRYINFLIRKFNSSGLNYPDSKYRFFKKSNYVLTKLANKPDLIYSRSFPLSSTIMAYKLQRELKVPWVMHLSDPWTLSPIHKLGSAQEWNETMERECMKDAAIVSLTSLETLELYRNKYPEYRSKMMFFPNVFDLEDKKSREYTFNNKIKVVYTGGLVENRSPKHFFKAIVQLHKKHPEIIDDFEFIFAGALDRKNRSFFQKNIPSVKHIGLLPFHDAIVLQETADVLLVIDTPFENTSDAVFFPSKLLDYMLIQRRIIALTDKNSVTWKVVDKKLGDCFLHDDVNKIIHFFIKTWHAWKEEDKDYFRNKAIDMNYSAETNAERLNTVFRKVVNET